MKEETKELYEFLAGRNKPFFIDTFRGILNKFDREEISMSKFVETLNIIAYNWNKLNSPQNVQECDTTEAKSIGEPLVTNNHAEAIGCYVSTEEIKKKAERIANGFRHTDSGTTQYEAAMTMAEWLLKKTTLYSSPIGGGMRWDIVESFIRDCLNEKHPSIKNIIEGLKFIAGSVSPVEKDDWISVEDRLPDCTVINSSIEASEEVQIFDTVHGIKQGWMKGFLNDSKDDLFPEYKKGYWLFENSNAKYENVTHWRPLPAPPEI